MARLFGYSSIITKGRKKTTIFVGGYCDWVDRRTCSEKVGSGMRRNLVETFSDLPWPLSRIQAVNRPDCRCLEHDQHSKKCASLLAYGINDDNQSPSNIMAFNRESMFLSLGIECSGEASEKDFADSMVILCMVFRGIERRKHQHSFIPISEPVPCIIIRRSHLYVLETTKLQTKHLNTFLKIKKMIISVDVC